jgi:hypothetical protein
MGNSSATLFLRTHRFSDNSVIGGYSLSMETEKIKVLVANVRISQERLDFVVTETIHYPSGFKQAIIGIERDKVAEQAYARIRSIAEEYRLGHKMKLVEVN